MFFRKFLSRKRIDAAQYDDCLKLLFNFPLITDEKQSVAEVAKIAKLYGLTVYDASYLELAIRKNFSLAILDKQLIIAARKAHVELVFNDN